MEHCPQHGRSWCSAGRGTAGDSRLRPARILSSSRPNSARKDSVRKGESSDCGTPKPLTERGNVLFSPYNMVKLIPSKEHSEMFGQYREPSYADAYDDSP